MGLIIVPQEYDNLPRNLAPICIEDHDAAGGPINLEWIDRGVRPIHGCLCHLTEPIVGDLWAVSEVPGNAVHSLWLEYGDNSAATPPGKSRLAPNGKRKTSALAAGVCAKAGSAI